MKKCKKAEYKGIWVIAEKQNNKITAVSYELISKARELKTTAGIKEPVTAVLLGENLEVDATFLAEAGAEYIILIDHPRLQLFQNETYAVVLQALIEEKKPAIVFMGATTTGSDLAPTLGAKLWTGVAAHCVDLKLDEDSNLLAVVPAFGGKVLGDILCPEQRPQMATVRQGILAKPVCYRKSEYSIENYNPLNALQHDREKVTAISITPQENKGIALEDAPVVIAGGFGVDGEAGWKMLSHLATITGGAVGCTRPPLDEGFSNEEQMIGTSGKSVRPDVYIGIGISGATHHLCGIKDAGLIVAINKDANAPIFEVADIGIVADANELLPKLIEQMKREDVGVCAPLASE